MKPSVLFLCTGNSARSQMAEALLSVRSAGRYRVGSAGIHPVSRVNPYAIEALRALGIAWQDKLPKSIDGVLGETWDLVITVCDRAKESCPTLPGRPVYAHWSLDDPAAVEGDVAAKQFDSHTSSMGDTLASCTQPSVSVRSSPFDPYHIPLRLELRSYNPLPSAVDFAIPRSTYW